MVTAEDLQQVFCKSGDTLGDIRFAGADGTDLQTQGAKIAAEVNQSLAPNDMPGRLVFSTTADSANSPTERMRILSTGDIKHTGSTGSDETNKLARYVVPSHDTNQEDVVVFQVENESSSNQLTFGGGTSSYNAATNIVFRTASAGRRLEPSGCVSTARGGCWLDCLMAQTQIFGFAPSIQVAGNGASAAMSIQRYLNGAGEPHLLFKKAVMARLEGKLLFKIMIVSALFRLKLVMDLLSKQLLEFMHK